MSGSVYTAKRVVTIYTVLNGLFTLAVSLIWAINTIFLIREGGLSLFQVMLVNAIFTLGSMVFEIPTGVVADTIGRRASILLSTITLALSTVLYVVTPILRLGFAGFAVASVILGLGYTFQTGAVDAWLVDALDATGFASPKERVFARGQMAAGVGMLSGSLLGGLLGQFDLALPFVVRTALIVVCFFLVLVAVRDSGFERRPMRLVELDREARSIFMAGVRYGWRNTVVRPLLWVSALGGIFLMYGFYAWQPYVLELLGDPSAVWLLGVVQALFSAAGIAGNALVARIMGEGGTRRDPAKILEVNAWASAAMVLCVAGVGYAALAPGLAPAAIAIVGWLAFGAVLGISGPVRMSYLNEHIPSAQRATVLSLDAFFSDAGGSAGQPALGWLSDRASIPVAWLVGGVFVALTAPLYRAAGRAAHAREDMQV